MRILLVDDEVELTDPLSRLLQRQGYAVDVASDGETGYSLALSGHYDLLILDWMLPGKSGLDICREIRASAQTSPPSRPATTPVLFLTAKDTVDDRVDGLDAGADDYLVKPFELRELLARVRALLRRPTGTEMQNLPDAAAAVVHFDGLRLDIENQIASRSGQSIELSEKEVQLLAYLMRSPHQLLTHRQIYDAVWGPGAAPSSNALAAQMKLLRKKIEASDQPTLIHTVYGKGYRFGKSQ
ncbi:MAG: response regulator transcription factor [Phormidesmis sp.]